MNNNSFGGKHMPGFDGTGPRGRGPLTGRGLGPCGRGFGFGRGFGRANCSNCFIMNLIMNLRL